MKSALIAYHISNLFVLWYSTLSAYVKFWWWGGSVGPGLRVHGSLRVMNAGRLIIGRGVRINSATNNFVGGTNPVSIWVGKKSTVSIGDGTGLSNATIVSVVGVTIGRDVLIGGGCEIYDSDFHQIKASDRTIGLGTIEASEVMIGDRAFIGAWTKILRGTQIGENSVIGAGSVVGGVIPPNELWWGVPARRIRPI